MDTLDSMDTTGDPTISHPTDDALSEMMTIDNEVAITPAPADVDTLPASTNDREHMRANSATPAPVVPYHPTVETPVVDDAHMRDVSELEAGATITPAPVHIQTPASPGTFGRTNTRADSATPTPVVSSQATVGTTVGRTVEVAAGTIAVPKETPLRDIPELADRYVPVTSTELGVDFRNPHKFCLKPPFWSRWTSEEYQKLGAWLERQDLSEIARELDKPVQEVGCMLDNVAITPLHDAQEASRRGVDGMNKWFERYGKYGAPSREWTDKQIKGELSGVSSGIVCLTLENGNKREVQRKHLTAEDHTWLKENLASSDLKALSEDATQDQDSEDDTSLENYREWTAEKFPATFSGVSFEKVHLVRPDGSRFEISKDQLTVDDESWMKEEDAEGEDHVSKALRCIIRGSNTSEEALWKNALTVWRYWTMERYEGRMCGISSRVMHVIIPNGSRKEIPVTELTREDVDWIRANISTAKRKVLSGTAAEEKAKSAAGGSKSGSA